MYKIAVASGKGGTGKTTVSVNLFNIAQEKYKENATIVDCDVEEPNVNLYLNGEVISKKDATLLIPEVNLEKCTYCGICSEVCAYNSLVVIKSLEKWALMEEDCHGCGACTHFCPENALTEKSKKMGEITHLRYNRNCDIIEGRLKIGEATPTPVIKQTIANIPTDNKITIFDAPPGTSCSLIETIEDVDFVILVAEPTPFGLNDLQLAVDTVKKVNKNLGLVINKSTMGDIGLVRDYAKEEELNILIEIPFSNEIAKISSNGVVLTNELPELKISFEKMLEDITSIIDKYTNQIGMCIDEVKK